MQNIPIFTAEHGLASLILREIPYSGSAYVMLRAVWNGQTAALLAECRQFCLAAGAETVFASQERAELPARHAYDILELSRPRAGLPLPDRQVALEPLTENNAAVYLDIYNRCFRAVPGAASYDREDMRRLMGKDLAFLAKRDGRYAAVAELGEGSLAGVAVLPEFRGLGHDWTLTVLARLETPVLKLRAASTNTRALALYRRLGFGADQVVSRWWKC